MSHSYQDVEPEFQYHKGETHDIIEFQVKDFKKDQLRVHFSCKGVLTVSGERPQEGSKRIRFRKDINFPKDCEPNEIRAKLSSGVLFITIPKKDAPQPPQRDSLKQVQQQDNGKLKQGGSSSEEAKGAMATPNENAAMPKPESKSFISGLKMEKKTAIKVVANVTVVSLVFVVLFYVYKIYAPVIMHV
ncbi:hypothetical protein Goklo_014913 [Gossypium klotzschianum]|uniref:SHSP domain-containing protein n=1 Tax=Gossypium klotzschianum TaxID=34286 RepID=A0A7J8U930_9ROSI|nr:hypothetical protein [Gossypium klotzschianum]